MTATSHRPSRSGPSARATPCSTSSTVSQRSSPATHGSRDSACAISWRGAGPRTRCARRKRAVPPAGGAGRWAGSRCTRRGNTRPPTARSTPPSRSCRRRSAASGAICPRSWTATSASATARCRARNGTGSGRGPGGSRARSCCRQGTNDAPSIFPGPPWGGGCAERARRTGWRGGGALRGSARAVAGSLAAALVLARDERSPALVARRDDAPARGVLLAAAPWGPLVLSLEVTTANPRHVARARYGWRPAPVESRVSLSDLLLFDPPPDSLPATLESAALRARGSGIVPSDRPLGLYWELYGLTAGGEMVTTAVSVIPLKKSVLGLGRKAPVPRLLCDASLATPQRTPRSPSCRQMARFVFWRSTGLPHTGGSHEEAPRLRPARGRTGSGRL